VTEVGTMINVLYHFVNLSYKGEGLVRKLNRLRWVMGSKQLTPVEKNMSGFSQYPLIVIKEAKWP